MIFSFVLFFLNDFNDAAWKKRQLNWMFPLGGVLLSAVTANLVHTQIVKNEFMGGICWVWLFIAILFAMALIYTLFFAIPFDASYSAKKLASDCSGRRLVCRSGVYALCRHPGVLWMAGMYFFLWAAMGGKQLYWTFLSTTICNTAYVIFQDVWTFPRIFLDYGSYRKDVPFLLPNRKSMTKCIDKIVSKKG